MRTETQYITNFQTSKRKKIIQKDNQEVRRKKGKKKINPNISSHDKNVNELLFQLKDKYCQTKLQIKSSSILCTSDI